MSPYFRGLSEASLRLLDRAASRTQLAAGEELETGGACLYLLATGEVSASTAPDSAGISEVVGHETPGSVFGGGRLTGEHDVPVYRAVGPAQVYVWEPAELERLLGASDELRRQLETRLSLRRRRGELADLLRGTPLFRQAGRPLTRWLVASSTLGRFESGSAIFRQGDEGDELFLIVSGEIAFFQDEAPEPVRLLHRGDFFGEIALVEGSARTASAVAVSDAEVLVVGRQAFDLLCRRSSSFRHAVRLSTELRLESDVSGRPEPELVWLVNDTARPTEELAALVVDALREEVGQVAGAHSVQRANGVTAMLEAGRAEEAAYVVCCSDATVSQGLGRHVADRAGSVVYFTADAEAPFPYPRTSLHALHTVIVSPRDGAPRRRDAFVLADTGSVRRIARAVAHRRVGVALGGGAAWGYAHVALLRGLERMQIPVDLVVGASVGSIVGAFYASQGLRGLDRLVDARLELSAAAVAAIATTSSVDLFLKRHIPETRLEELSLPFATVAVEARTGREKVFRHGSLSAAVRASCSLPGIFGRPIRGGDRYLDACVRHNVPASCCTDAGADFVIACDVVPAPTAARDSRSGFGGLVLELFQINRLTDTVRSLYWLASDSGELQAGLADALFSPDLGEFAPWDFHRANAIVERADEQLDEWLLATAARYRALSRTVRSDG
ncbi:MAG TPA: cyclic nucleotide-binding and patatin-like phospholipase domain-containing protein [Gaiellaceae bacterium]